MTNRGQFAQLLAAGLTLKGWDELDELPEEFSTFCDVGTSDSAYEEEQHLAGLGLVRKKEEGAPITYDDPIQGGSIRAFHDTYALGWSCTEEMLADDKYSKIKQIPKELMPSMRYVVEQVAANPLNLGFTTHLTVDGMSFFNAAHPLLGGGSQSNVHATNSPLSQVALQDMVILGENMVNERGLKRAVKFDTVHIAPENQWIAQKILQSEYEPGTGNNDINVTKGLYSVNQHHFFTSTTQWFVSAKRYNNLHFWWRRKPSTDAADDFDTKGSKHSITARFSSQAFYYIGWAGSTGVGS